MEHLTPRFLTSLMLITSILECSGQGPMYANLRQEMDTFSTRMKQAFESFNAMLGKFDSKLDTINVTMSTDVGRLDQSVELLKTELNRSDEHARDVGERTTLQLSRLQNEMYTMKKDSARVKRQLQTGQGLTREMIAIINEMREESQEFQMKIMLLLNAQANMSTVVDSIDNNKAEVTNEISILKRELTSAISGDLLSIQTAIASLLNDMVDVKEGVKNFGFSTDCPSGWTRYENSCYMMVDEETSWKLARFMCRQLSSFLVEIYSEREVNFLTSLTANKTTEVWTGGNIGKKGIWYWSESKSEVDFDLFKGDYPNGRTRQYCGTFLPTTLSFNDRNCGKHYQFICRKFRIQLEA